ncbi:hypothetical protein FRC11_005598 [Ceratobasidium sp. 423]|nr:hypothetical protein FRC11_005598 [Ceratobasidium sp. 423]
MPCTTHKGTVVNCATFFEHKHYEYKLLFSGELYFRPKGTYTFRSGPIVPKEPGSPFIVKPSDGGLDAITFRFEPTSRALGEVSRYAEFLPVQTFIASSQEAHGLVYTQGQGCVFDWVYGNRSPSWGCNLRYDEGEIYPSPDTEGIFTSNDKLLTKRSPPFANSQSTLKNSLNGFDPIGTFPSLEALGDVHVGFAQFGSISAGNRSPANNAHTHSTSTQPTLPFLVSSAPQPEARASSSPTVSRSVLRRTCSICNRVMRRPSALEESNHSDATIATIAPLLLQIFGDTSGINTVARTAGGSRVE